jgi:5'-3' exonuclease
MNEDEDSVYVVYGLDADLIFLTMASRKSNIYLLREATYFGKNRNNTTEDIQEELNYVCIDKLRTCLNNKLNNMSKKYYQHSRADNVDFSNDFIIVCYFLGNDFLPHIPSIDIKTGGLDFLIKCYLDIYIRLDTTILKINLEKNTREHKVEINKIFLEMFISSLARCEDHYFKKILPQQKEHTKSYHCTSSDLYDIALWEFENLRDIQIDDPIKIGKNYPEQYKHRYYEYYFGMSDYGNVDILCYEFMRGIMWTTLYYFDECPSWSWQYPYSHGPFITDISNYLKKIQFNINKEKFKKGSSVSPCVQLLTVLPPQCRHMLPKNYRSLTKTSVIADMFPSKITIDYLNTDMQWKCIPNIPIADIDRIKRAVYKIKLTEQEVMRDRKLDIFYN